MINPSKAVDGKLPKELGIYLKNNGDADYINLDMTPWWDDENSNNPTTDIKELEGELPPLPPISIPGDKETSTIDAGELRVDIAANPIRYRLDGHLVASEEELIKTFRAMAHRPVIIRAEETLPVEEVTKLLETMNEAGINRTSIVASGD